ncbi:MAG TPA: 4Fe-4S binding protein [Epulopiscium sp.]|nr:4Fe-4S binding protein [Candidatus Epulonipiscium sp.]
MKRNIVYIDQEKCTGCGTCVNTCHEGAIGLVDGKAQLLSDEYCDGLGNCLRCPEDAISIIEREADAYDIDKAPKRVNPNQTNSHVQSGCPGTMAKSIKYEAQQAKPFAASTTATTEITTEPMLQNWPVQLQLAPVQASYFNEAHLLIAADCTAYAYPNMHQDFIAGRITLIGCPKLDDNNYYAEKLTQILQSNEIKSITVLRMEVPCCTGIVNSVKTAMLNAQLIAPYNEVTIGLDGSIK